MNQKELILNVNNLSLGFQNRNNYSQVLHDVNFDLFKGEVLGIVGESGSGKSVTALSIMKLLNSPPAIYQSGKILFGSEQVDILQESEKDLQKIRGNEISMIFQEPMTSLNPSHRVGKQILEAIQIHRKVIKSIAIEEILDLFSQVFLPDPKRIFRAYPHELSGGQLQRVMISMAMINSPTILIADEPTTALDVTVQKQILKTIEKLQDEFDTSTIFISHDLGVIREIADRVLVMQKGKIVERGPVDKVFTKPQHAYTRGLIACRPPLNKRVTRLPTVEEMIKIKPEEHHAFLKGFEESLHDFEKRLDVIEKSQTILKVENLNKTFVNKKNWFGKPIAYNHALKNISLEVKKGEVLGLVGESGCGKTTLGNCILKLTPADSGHIKYKNLNLFPLSEKEMKPLRRNIQMIFQDPYSSLNPRMQIGEAIMEPMKVHKIGKNTKERIELACQLLEEVGMPADFIHRYPHQFSGGQRQRICIARTLSVNPEFIICDESVSALDVSVQAQVLNLLKDLKDKYGLTLIFISHDLSVIKHISDHIAVMNQGEIIEFGRSENIFNTPSEDYTVQLIEAIPAIGL